MTAASVEDQSATKGKLCIFLLQLGGPEKVDAIEPFLRNLFEDVLPLPGFLKRPLAQWIAKRRTPEVTPLYNEIGGGSPILKNTREQAAALQTELGQRGWQVEVMVCMRYSPPRAAECIDRARQSFADSHWVALPLYPQYSLATTGSSLDELASLLNKKEWEQLTSIRAYPDNDLYLDAMAESVRDGLQRFAAEKQGTVHVIFSAHGLPMRLVKQGDPYPEHVKQTVEGILTRLEDVEHHHLAFQSRVGPVKWLEPATDKLVAKLGDEGVQRMLVVPVSFVSEHVETLHELDIQLAQTAREHGVEQFERSATPTVHPDFVAALANLVEGSLSPG